MKNSFCGPPTVDSNDWGAAVHALQGDDTEVFPGWGVDQAAALPEQPHLLVVAEWLQEDDSVRHIEILGELH